MIQGIKLRREDKDYLVLSNCMRDDISTSRLQTLVSKGFESKMVAVVGGGLLGISNPEGNVIEVDKTTLI